MFILVHKRAFMHLGGYDDSSRLWLRGLVLYLFIYLCTAPTLTFKKQGNELLVTLNLRKITRTSTHRFRVTSIF